MRLLEPYVLAIPSSVSVKRDRIELVEEKSAEKISDSSLLLLSKPKLNDDFPLVRRLPSNAAAGERPSRLRFGQVCRSISMHATFDSHVDCSCGLSQSSQHDQATRLCRQHSGMHRRSMHCFNKPFSVSFSRIRPAYRALCRMSTVVRAY